MNSISTQRSRGREGRAVALELSADRGVMGGFVLEPEPEDDQEFR